MTKVERLRAEAEAAEARAVEAEQGRVRSRPCPPGLDLRTSTRMRADAAWKALAEAEKKAEADAIPPVSDGWDDDPFGGAP